jgi:hypothetical protein
MERIALDGPFKGKRYTLPNGVLTVIDHWYDDKIFLHKVTYHVYDDGLRLEAHHYEDLDGKTHEA